MIQFDIVSKNTRNIKTLYINTAMMKGKHTFWLARVKPRARSASGLGEIHVSIRQGLWLGSGLGLGVRLARWLGG